MKKLILCLALLAGMTFVACSDDDDKKNSGCVTCKAYTIQGENMPAEEVCKGENGHAFVDGEDMEMGYDEYVALNEVFTDCE